MADAGYARNWKLLLHLSLSPAVVVVPFIVHIVHIGHVSATEQLPCLDINL
jgi:hypothetical protein